VVPGLVIAFGRYEGESGHSFCEREGIEVVSDTSVFVGDLAMPGSSHVDLVIGDKSIAELRLTGSGSGNEGDERLTEDFFARVPLTVFKKMLAAKTIRGYIYWRAENEIVERNELRLFTLDAKALRTLSALDARAR